VSDHTLAPEEIRSRVRRFLADEVILDDGIQLEGSTPLLSGLVDSIGLMELVSFLEDEFAITLENQDVDAVHFRTIDDIARLVSQRTQGR
jgi:methoxymalonate biosynthesis acyl carrier protein